MWQIALARVRMQLNVAVRVQAVRIEVLTHGGKEAVLPVEAPNVRQPDLRAPVRR